MGLYSIFQTRDAQEKQYRCALLDEIIEWGISILSCGSDINFEYVLEFLEMEGPVLEGAEEGQRQADLKTLWIRYKAVTAKTERAKVLAKEFTNKNLPSLVNDVDTKLGLYLGAVKKRSECKVGERDAANKELTETGQPLLKSVNALIVEASKIRLT